MQSYDQTTVHFRAFELQLSVWLKLASCGQALCDSTIENPTSRVGFGFNGKNHAW